MKTIFTTSDMFGTSTHKIVQAKPECYYTEFMGYVPHVPLTPEEQAVANAEAAMFEKYEWEAGQCESNPAPHGYFRTPQAAQHATELHEAMAAATTDIEAFGAPSECYSLALNPLLRELETLEAEYGTRLNPPTLGEQYAERGLEDRTRPIAESLPAGMHDDRDVIAALGERTAWRYDAPVRDEFGTNADEYRR